ncbi:unnamed protein product [Prorocentrum cordatum]|uniref:Uncharacterized protein n=1 Tax=Prorocentrum cordatum TaxID=2364126 RepID=A0ABN9WL72_9DINO|nr:unnamed protein product [Polarella glacialis]
MASPLVRQIHMFLLLHRLGTSPPRYLYLTDGGPLEDLGVVQLLRRRRRWILSVDCGDDPACELLDLRNAIELARRERTCSFFDVEDPRRDLEVVLDEYAQGREPFLHLGVLYPAVPGGRSEEEGEIFHVRMRLLEQPGEEKTVQPEVSREEVMQTAARPCHAVPRASRRADRDAPLVQPAMMEPIELERSVSRGARCCAREAWELPRSQLGGACCECCHGWVRGGFPHTHTANQFFTPLMWANFCRLGRELCEPAVQALSARQHAAPQRAAPGAAAAGRAPPGAAAGSPLP